jgi:hypothetical protein
MSKFKGVSVNQAVLLDPRLSLKAKGLLGVFMATGAKESTTMVYMRTLSSDGETAHRSAMQELEKFGYLTKDLVSDDYGQFIGWEYTLHAVVEDDE